MPNEGKEWFIILKISEPEPSQATHTIEPPLHIKQFELSQKLKRENDGYNSAVIGKYKPPRFNDSSENITQDIMRLSPEQSTKIPV